MTNSNQEIVLDFLRACHDRDIGRMMSFFHPEDCTFHNIPWKPISGIEAIGEFLQNMLESSSEIDWQVRHIAETAGGAVLTERTDRFRFQGKPMAVPVMGIFELRDGKITAWRDYFDSAQVSAQMPPRAGEDQG